MTGARTAPSLWWVGLLAHSGAVAAALLALPGELFSPLWLLLFCLPGVLFLALSTRRAARVLGFAERLGFAVLVEVGLGLAIFQTDAAPVPQAALTYVLLAPLAFGVLRRQDLDVLHSLFLAFCLLLIGAVLRREIPEFAVGGFVLCAALVLQIETHGIAVAAAAVRLRTVGLASRLARGLGVALACVLAGLGLFELLRALPGPGARPTTGQTSSAAGERTQVGLSSRFDLGGSSSILDLVYDELVSVRAVSGRVPTNLYLRHGYFDLVGFDNWEVRAGRPTLQRDLADRPYVAPRVRGLGSRRLIIERLVGEGGLIFLVPGTHDLRPQEDSLVVREVSGMATLTEVEPRGPLTYRLAYQDRRNELHGRQVDRSIPGLIGFPARRMPRVRELVDEWVRTWATRSSDPVEVALAIIEGLQQRCRYELREPRGPSAHPLENFLFGEKVGFCMHFASALGIMLRMRGIPCRIGVGLYGGDRATTDGRQRIYGSQHAHAWIEIPLEGLGWVEFEATPAAALRLPRRIPEPDVSGLVSGEEDEPDPEDEKMASGGRLGSAVWPWLGLFALLLVPLFVPRRRSGSNLTGQRPTPVQRTARRHLARLLQALAARGLPRARGVTLEGYLAQLRRHEELEPADLQRVGAAFAAYQDVRFGRCPFDDARLAVMDDAITALR